MPRRRDGFDPRDDGGERKLSRKELWKINKKQPKQPKEPEIKIKEVFYTDWRQCLSYPNDVPVWATKVLDALDKDFPLRDIEQFKSRVMIMKWIELAQKAGHIDFGYRMRLEQAIAPEF